jgi:hypothetical protein
MTNQHMQTTAASGTAMGLSILAVGLGKALGHPLDPEVAAVIGGLLAPLVGLLYKGLGISGDPLDLTQVVADPVPGPVVAPPPNPSVSPGTISTGTPMSTAPTSWPLAGAKT